MTNYLIYRLGSNGCNQPGVHRCPVGIVSAPSRQAAVDRFCAEGGEIFYANQRAEAVPESRASGDDWNSVLDADALATSHGEDAGVVLQ